MGKAERFIKSMGEGTWEVNLHPCTPQEPNAPDAVREKAQLEQTLNQCAAEALKQVETNKALREDLRKAKEEKELLTGKLAALEKKLETDKASNRQAAQDEEALLRILLEAYKELDNAAMLTFEASLSKLNDDTGHRFQKQLDSFRKIREKKATEKAQASVNISVQEGGYAFLHNRLDNPHFTNQP